MTLMQRIYYAAYSTYIHGCAWKHKPEYRERLIARCRKALEGII